MIPIEGFLRAPFSDQAIFLGCCVMLVYGIARTERKYGSGLVALLIVVSFFTLALMAMSYLAVGGTL